MNKTTQCRLEWECERCGFPIADGAGAVRIDLVEVREAESLESDWINLTDPELRYPAVWLARHIACDDVDGPFYAIDVERIRTHGHLLWWTSHLMEKPWLTVTNWRGILRDRGVPA